MAFLFAFLPQNSLTKDLVHLPDKAVSIIKKYERIYCGKPQSTPPSKIYEQEMEDLWRQTVIEDPLVWPTILITAYAKSDHFEKFHTVEPQTFHTRNGQEILRTAIRNAYCRVGDLPAFKTLISTP